jgi:hypothetical protein
MMVKHAYDAWYYRSTWLRRRDVQLKMEPWCKMCMDQGKWTLARVADHIIPHRGDPNLFWLGRLQSLCMMHANRSKLQIETMGFMRDIGPDGFPIDPNHPFHKTSQR